MEGETGANGSQGPQGMSLKQCRLKGLGMETPAVLGGEAQGADGFDVLFGGITEIAFPTVARIFRGEFTHAVVAVGFGENRSGGNTGVSGVAVNYGLVLITFQLPLSVCQPTYIFHL